MAKDDNVFDINKFKKQQAQGKAPQPKQVTQQDVMDAPDVGCVRCGAELYIPAYRFKRLSKLLTGEPEDKMVQLQTMVCANCGWELGQELPDEDGNIRSGLEDMDTGPDNKETEGPQTPFDDGKG